MGKYAATRGIQSRSGRAWKDVGNTAFGSIRSEGDYYFQSFLSSADPTGLYRAYITSRDNSAYMRDYLNNRGLKWSDIRYPTRTSGFYSYGDLGRNAIMLSANLAKLYL